MKALKSRDDPDCPLNSFNMIGVFLVLLGGIIIGGLITFLASEKDGIFLFRLFSWAFFLRIIISFSLYLVSLSTERSGAFLGKDDFAYTVNAIATATLLEQGRSSSELNYKDQRFLYNQNVGFQGTPVGSWGFYDFVCGHLLYATGSKSPLVLLFFNCFLGSLLALLVYFLAKEVFNPKIGRVAAILSAFWPSMLLWSTQNLKDTLINFFTIILILFALFLRKRFKNIIYLPLICASLYLLSLLRSPIHWFWTGTLAIAWILSDYRLRRIILIICLVNSLTSFNINIIHSIRDRIVAMTFGFLALNPDRVVQKSSNLVVGDFVQELNARREERTEGRTVMEGIRFMNLTDVLYRLPLFFFATLLTPFPWQVSSLFSLGISFEMIVWYFLLPATFWGCYYGLRKRFSWSLFVLLPAIGYGTLIGVLEPNVGLLVRHKSAMLYLLLIFTAAGLVYRYRVNPKILV